MNKIPKGVSFGLVLVRLGYLEKVALDTRNWSGTLDLSEFKLKSLLISGKLREEQCEEARGLIKDLTSKVDHRRAIARSKLASAFTEQVSTVADEVDRDVSKLKSGEFVTIK